MLQSHAYIHSLIVKSCGTCSVKMTNYIHPASLQKQHYRFCSLTIFQEFRAEIKSKFRSGKFSWEDMNIHEATGLLKQLIRELPIPLMTLQHFMAFSLIESRYCQWMFFWPIPHLFCVLHCIYCSRCTLDAICQHFGVYHRKTRMKTLKTVV